MLQKTRASRQGYSTMSLGAKKGLCEWEPSASTKAPRRRGTAASTLLRDDLYPIPSPSPYNTRCYPVTLLVKSTRGHSSHDYIDQKRRRRLPLLFSRPESVTMQLSGPRPFVAAW